MFCDTIRRARFLHIPGIHGRLGRAPFPGRFASSFDRGSFLILYAYKLAGTIYSGTFFFVVHAFGYLTLEFGLLHQNFGPSDLPFSNLNFLHIVRAVTYGRAAFNF
jgi:hypothetical protein